jgi:hypothetical protein
MMGTSTEAPLGGAIGCSIRAGAPAPEIGAGATFRAALQPGPEQGTGMSSQVSQWAHPAMQAARAEARIIQRDRVMTASLPI